MSSYERLAERLIETQRTMLGKQAVNIARGVDGLSVTEDGQVADVLDDDRTIVGDLVESYVDVMGKSARTRLTDVAAEYDDLVLPANLGGPEEEDPDPEQAPDESEDTATEDADESGDSDTDDTEDGGQDADETAPTPPQPAEEDIVTNIWGDDAAVESERVPADPIDIVETDLDQIYVTVEDQHGQAMPIPVSQAIVDVVVEETDLGWGDIDHASSYLDAVQVERLVDAEPGTRLSFTVEGHEVKLHQNGEFTVQ